MFALPKWLTDIKKLFATSSGKWLGRDDDGWLFGLGNVDDTADADKPVSTAQLAAINGRQPFHGFVNRTGSSITSVTFDNATRTFTLAKVADYDVYHGGVLTTITANKTVVIGAGLGQHFIWLNSDGTLATSQAVWNLLDLSLIFVATVHWDGTTGIVAEERHDYRRNLIENRNQHDSWGAQYVSGFTPAPTFGPGAANTFSFTGGVIRDEDLYHTLSSPQTQCWIGYRVAGGATMTFDAAGTAYAKLNAGVPRYDNAGTLTNLSAAKYGIMWIYATNRPTTPVVSIIGQGEYNSVALAQAAAQPTLAGLAVAEWKLLYRVIVKNQAGALLFVQTDVLYNTSTGPAISAGAPATVMAANVSVDATGFDGKLATTDTNLQLVAQKVDDLVAGGGLTVVAKAVADNGGLLAISSSVMADTTGGAFTLLLPSAPAAGDHIQFVDAGNYFATYNLTVDPNGKKIAGLSENLILDSDMTVDLIYISATYGWRVTVGGVVSPPQNIQYLNNLVEKKVLAADNATVVFTGLSSLIDGDYYLEYVIQSVNSTAVEPGLTINADTAANYSSQHLSGGGSSATSGAGPTTYISLGYFDAASRLNHGSILIKKALGVVTFESRCFNKRTSNSYTQMFEGYYNQDVVVSSLNLTAGGNLFKAGSSFSLYRSNGAQQLIPYNPTDITGRSSDYPLKAGEVVSMTYASATSVPLYIATYDGAEYEITILGNNMTLPADSYNYLKFNNALYTAAVRNHQMNITGTSISYANSMLDYLRIGSGHIRRSIIRLCTSTLNKSFSSETKTSATGSSEQVYNIKGEWEEYTTPWASLGTIIFANAQSGKIIIRRIL